MAVINKSSAFFYAVIILNIFCILTVFLFTGRSFLKSPSERAVVYGFQKIFLKSPGMLWIFIVIIIVMFPAIYIPSLLTGTLEGLYSSNQIYITASLAVHYIFFTLSLYILLMNLFSKSNPVVPGIADPKKTLALTLAIVAFSTVVIIIISQHLKV